MANPFENVRTASECYNCEDIVTKGELMFAHDGEFICEQCAIDLGCVCGCGDYKKPEYETCYNCRDY